jgi:hypothetical protein
LYTLFAERQWKVMSTESKVVSGELYIQRAQLIAGFSRGINEEAGVAGVPVIIHNAGHVMSGPVHVLIHEARIHTIGPSQDRLLEHHVIDRDIVPVPPRSESNSRRRYVWVVGNSVVPATKCAQPASAAGSYRMEEAADERTTLGLASCFALSDNADACSSYGNASH